MFLSRKTNTRTNLLTRCWSQGAAHWSRSLGFSGCKKKNYAYGFGTCKSPKVSENFTSPNTNCLDIVALVRLMFLGAVCLEVVNGSQECSQF